MNWDQIKGKWKQLQGEAKQQWGKLTDDDMARIDGNRHKLVGALQDRYGKAREAAERQVDAWSSKRS